ncbi:microtubule-associated protein futsch-like isoform X3 [Armigeres subalbatus]|uniref:microtubule-associated protein futsch-like isoform X3 n=1 Tax=Armigeres subalbatus TaxID=124917 RepID=UPI002ED44CAD
MVEEVIFEAKIVEAKKPVSPVAEPDTVEKVEEVISEAKTFETKKPASPVSEPDTVEKVEQVIPEVKTFEAKKPASPVSEPDTDEKVEEVISEAKTVVAKKPASPVSEPDTVEKVEEVISEAKTFEAKKPASPVSEPDTVEKVEEMIFEAKTFEAKKTASPVSEPDTVEKVEEVISETRTDKAKTPASPVSEPDTIEKVDGGKTIEAEKPASPVSEPDTVENVEEVISETRTVEAEQPASSVAEPGTVEKVEELISEGKTDEAEKPASPVSEPDTVEKVEEVISEAKTVVAKKPASPVSEPDTVEKEQEVISEDKTVEAEIPASPVSEPDTVEKVEEVISEAKTDEAEKPASPVSEPDTVEKVEEVISEAKTVVAKKPASPVTEPDTVEKVEEVISETRIVEAEKPASPVAEPDTVEKVEEVISETRTVEAEKPASSVAEPDTVQKVEELISEGKTDEAEKPASPVSEPDTVEKVEQVISEAKTYDAKKPASPVSEPDTVEKVEEVILEDKIVEDKKPASPVSEPDTVEKVEEVIPEAKTFEAKKPASPVSEPDTVEKVEEMIFETKTFEAKKTASPVSEPDTVEKVEEVISETRTDKAKTPASPVSEPDTVEKVEEVISEGKTVEAEKPASPVSEPDTVENVEEVISETRTVEAEKPASSVAEPYTVEKVEELISEGKTDEAEKPASPVSEPDTVEKVEEVISEAKTVVAKKPASPVTEPDTVEKVEEVISETRTVEAEKPASPVAEPDTVEKVEEVISETRTVEAEKPASSVAEPDTVEKVEELISEGKTDEAEKPASPVSEPDTVENVEEVISEAKTVVTKKPASPVTEPDTVEKVEEVISETRTVEAEKPASPVSEPDTVEKVEEVISEAKTYDAKKPASPVSEPDTVEKVEEVILEDKIVEDKKPASPVSEPDTVEKVEEVIPEAKTFEAKKPASPVPEPDTVEKVEELISEGKTDEAEKPASPVSEPDTVEKVEEVISETRTDKAKTPASPVSEPDTVEKVEEVIYEGKTVEAEKPASSVSEPDIVENVEEVISETRTVEAEKPASSVAEPGTVEKVEEVISEAKTVVAKKPTSPVTEPDTVEKVEEVISETRTVEAEKPASPVAEPDTVEKLEEMISEDKTVEAMKPTLPVAEPEKVEEEETEPVGKVEIVSETRTVEVEKPASPVSEPDTVGKVEEVISEAKTVEAKKPASPVSEPKKVEEDETEPLEKVEVISETKTADAEKSASPIAEPDTVEKMEEVISEAKIVGAEKPASPVAEPDVVEKVEEVITKAKTIEAKKPASPVAEPKKVEEDETEPVEKVEAISETKIVEAEKQESPVAGPDTVGKVEEVISEAKTVETKKPVSPVAELKKVEEDETEPVEKVEVISETKIVEAEKPASPVAEPDTIDKVKEVESEHVEKVEVISEAKTVEAKKPTSPVSEPDTVEKVEEVISEATTVEAKKPASPVTRPDTIEHVEEVDSELSKMVEEVVSEAKTVEAKKPALPVSEPDTIEKVKEVESELVKKVEVVVSEAKTAKAEKSASAVAEFHSVENQEEVDYELVEKVDITYVTKPKEKLTVEKPITADEAKTSEPEKPTLPVAEFESVDKIDLAVSETKFEKESSLEKFAEKSLISMVTESVSETDHSFTDANHDHVHTKIIENIDDSSSRLEKANNLEKNIENIAITTTNESEIAEQNIIHETESRIVEKSIVEMNESTSGMTGTHYSTAQTGMSTNEQNIERQELSVDESKPIDENTLKILRLTDSQFDETTFITETTTLRKILEATEKVKTSLELRLNSKQADISNVAQESEHAFSFDERRDSDAERLVRSELSAPSERSDILEDLRREESRLADTRKSSLSAVEGSNYDDDSPLLTDFTTSSITYVSERVDSSSLDLMAGDSFGDFLKVVPAVEKKTEAISPSSCISYATTISETIESFTHDADKLVYTGGSIQQDIPTEYERSVSLSDNAASDFSTESATKYNLPYDTESDSHDVAPGIPKPRDELQEIRVVKPSKLMSIDPRHESGSPQSDVTEYTESVSYVESIIDSTNYDCALKQREKLQHDQQQKQEEKKDVQEKLILEEGQTAKEEKGKLILKTHTAEKKETTQVKKKSKPKATITKISLQKQTPIEISKQSIKTVDIKSGSKSVEYTTSTSRTTTVSRTFTSTRTHGYMQSTLSRDQKVLKPLNLTESTHSSPVKSSHRSTTSTTVVQPSLEKRARSSRDTSGSRTDMAATKSLLKSEPISTSAVKKQDPKPGVQSTKATKVSVERTGRSSSSSITSSTSRVYRTRKTTIESIDKQEPIRKADKEQANLVTKTTVSASKSSKERTNKSLIPVKVSTAKGSPKKETPSRTSAGKSPVKKPTKTTIEVQPKETVIVKTSKAATIDIEQMASAAKIGFVKTAPRVTKTVHSSGDSKRDDTYRCKSAMHYSYKDAVTFDHAEIPSSLPSSPSRLNKSSSNSTNVLTSEVFTRTIDSSKSIEVIYRQPSTSNELIRKINEYRYNDIDLTTDSSLSDSIALPSSSSEHESDVLGKRKRSGSPASPKPYATTSSTSLSTMATSRKQATTAVASSTSQQNINEQRYRKSDIWMRTGPQPSEVIPVPLDSGDDEIYQALHTVDRRTVASLDGIVMESRISPILDFRASTPPRLKYKFDYDSSLFTDDKQEEETQASANFEETDTQPQTEISIPKPTPRSQSNLAAEADASAVTTSVTTTTTTTAATSSAAAVASSLTKSALASKPTEEASIVDTATDHDRPAGLSGDASELSSSQEPLPVPRPRTSISSRTDTQTRSSIIESFDHPEDSIEQYPEPLSQRQESVASEDFSGAAQKDSGEFETSEDELPETKFYIGERSSDIITRTSSEKRSDYAFDNIGYEYSQDSGADDEPQLDQFKAYREKVAQEDSFTLKQLQEVESGTDLDQEIKAEVIEVIEGIAEPKVFELDLEKSFDAPRQPVVHSPIKPQVAKLVASAKPFAVESTDTKNLPQPELTASSEIIKRTFDELTIEKTLEEVKESLDAVHEELIESVVDGKLIKQSPSEFEFKVLPSSKYSQDPIYETQQEEMVAPTTSATVVFAETVTTTTIVSEPIMLTETKAESFEQKTSDPESKEISFESARPDAPTPISSDSSFAKLDISPRMRKPPHHPKGTRWSATDIDSSGESHYQSFEQTTDSSRPQSSDVDNLIQQYASSEYETALDASIIPASTEFHSAASTLNSFNVSSHDSMKSFDSESSGNLASIESEATETLVPSTMDIDFDSSDAAALIHDDSEDDLREKLLLDDKDELSAVSVAIPVAMKRSQEMHFTADLKDEVMQDTQEVFQLQEDVERIAQEQSEKLSSSIGHALDLMESMKASSLEDVKTECIDDIKLGTSLEDGSILSISLSSASNLETIMENLPEKGAESLPTHMEIGLDAITPIVGTEMIGDITLTSTVVQEGDVNFLNTQATTETVVAEETSKKRGHKRTESTISGQLMSEIAAEARESLDSQEESVSLEASKQSSLERDDTREESSDSDYDRYESEYSRSFRAPLIQSQKKKKDKLNDGFEMEVDHDRRNSFSPSSSVIETIVEDVHAEIEQEDEVQQLMEFKEEKLREYKQTSATSIPDIQVTDDVQMDELEEEEAGASYSTKTMQRETSDPKIQYAKQEEFKISEEQYQEMIEQKYKSKMADITTKFDFEGEAGDDSAGSDSFEMLEQPDISDEFVIVEEVAREAHECDMEGKSVSIKQIKMEKKHDEDVEKILVKSAPAHTNAGSMYANMREDMMYTFEDSPPTGSDEVDPNGVTGDLLNNGFPLEESKRWVEMQLAETQNYRYPYDERLEDIKEEDTDFEVGSSRIGSIKDSFSSTPDYDMLAKRLASRGGEHDDISMSSLQEFENLEHVISLENRKMQQGSQDSLSNGSFTKRFLARGGHGDDISLSSLKEFEGLETACLEAHLIEIKAKEEAALLLSRSDESNKSDRSNGAKRSPPTNGTVVRATTSSTTVTTGPETVAKVEVKTVTTEMSKDSLSTTTTATTVTTISHESQIRHALEEEDTSHLLTVSSDSLDGTRLQRQTISRETLPSAHSSSDSLELNNKNNIDVMTSSIDSIEFSRAGAMTTRSSRSDSIEQMALQQPQRSDSTDSIEMHHAVMSRASETKRDSLDSLPYSIENKSASGSPTKPATGQRITTESVIIAGTSTVSYQQGGMTKDISVDSLTGQDAFLTSTESLETSSTATNATYQNETDSQMSSSVTSCGSITMVEGDIEGFGLQESVTFKSSSSSSSTIVMASSSSIQQQQQQQQTIRSSTSSTSAGTSTSVRREFPLSEIELLSRQMYPGDLAFDDAKESAKEKLQSKTTEKED